MSKKGEYSADEVCPECGIVFRGPVAKPAGGPLSKCCPKGHWSSMGALRRSRRARDGQQASEQSAGMKVRKMGITRDVVEALSLALQGMVASYERVHDQFPAGSRARAMLDGAMEKPVALAKALLA